MEMTQWTRELILRIDEWVKCGYWRVGYHLTQVFTVHGSFKSYTKRICKTSDDLCMYCHERDTATHAHFEYPNHRLGTIMA